MGHPLFDQLALKQELSFSGFVDLSSNVTPQDDLHASYPSMTPIELTDRYLKTHLRSPHLNSGCLLFTRGSIEGIDLIIRWFRKQSSSGQKVIIPGPVFPMYQYYCDQNEVETQAETLYFDAIQGKWHLPDLIRPDAGLIFICNPHNPSGTVIPFDELEALIEKFDGWVVVDEAYIEFSEERSALEFLSKHPRLMVLRTFSKAWQLAGERCGVVIADPKIILMLREFQGPYAFPVSIQKSVLDQLKSQSTMIEHVRSIREERNRLVHSFSEFSFMKRIYRSAANFIFAEVEDATSLIDYAFFNRILIENTSSSVPNSIRVSIGKPSDNTLLLSVFEQFQSQLNLIAPGLTKKLSQLLPENLNEKR